MNNYINHTYYPLSVAGDECSNCTQLCNFSPDRFFCSCNDGYILDEDGETCNGMFQYSYRCHYISYVTIDIINIQLHGAYVNQCLCTKID